jgi:hypothetical protein
MIKYVNGYEHKLNGHVYHADPVDTQEDCFVIMRLLTFFNKLIIRVI